MKETIKYMMGVFALLLAGCSNEQDDRIDPGQTAEIRFEATGGKFVQTRANDLIGANQTGPNFGTFYMLQTDKEGRDPSWGHYTIASSDAGKLSPTDDNFRLIWEDWEKEYFFRGISTPQGEDSANPGVTFTHNEDGTQTGTVRFGDYQTGLEYFVGVTVGPKSLVTHNQTVMMNFRRQVCKLVFCQFQHLSQDDKEVGYPTECTIIFPNLPKTASFDMKHFRAQRNAHNPDKPLVNGNDYVTFNYREDDLGVSMEWSSDNDFNPKDEATYYMRSFYLPPFKFGGGEGNMPENQLGFFIVKTKNNGKTYTGNLFGNGQRSSIYAGEYLLIENVELKDGPTVGGGDGSAIAQWQIAPPTEHPHHRLPGIYSQEDADKLLDALLNKKEIPATFYEETAEGKKIRLFKNIDWSSVTTKITIPDGYVLEGQGFHIKLGVGGSISGNQKGELYINGQLYKDGELQKE